MKIKIIMEKTYLTVEKYKDICKDKMGAGKVSVQVSEFPSMYKWDIIVAFDIGTSYSGYAYSDKKEFATNTINLNEWTENYTLDPKAKAPTTVLLNGDQTFDSFGFEAEERYAQKVKENTHDKCYRFRNFKMNLNYEKVINKTDWMLSINRTKDIIEECKHSWS